MKNPLIVALDVDDVGVAQKLIDRLTPYVGGFKIGPRITFKADPLFIRELSENSLVFFDHKFFDIPSTTVSAVRAAAELGAHWVTVHALSGPECMAELAKLQTELRERRPLFRIVAVTILTSFTEATLPPIWKKESILQSVTKLAGSALEAGLDSLVCSPLEIERLREVWPEAFLVVPGIRLPDGDAGDQRRTATPNEAVRAGASALVVGRPIIASKDPVAAARSITESLGV